jgi:hypothetical protein
MRWIDQISRGYGSRLLRVLLFSWVCYPFVGALAAERDELVEKFVSPPQQAKPLTWWQWMNGNVTKDGVAADLNWMHRVGIGGVQNIDASMRTPQLVKRPATYLTAEWREMLRYSATLADKLGLEFDIETSPGWSVTGGPWVKPNEAMKKLVWSETHVDGGQPLSVRLAEPPSVSGLFQNIPLADHADWASDKLPTYYADIATVAYCLPDGEPAQRDNEPLVMSSVGAIDAKRLSDGDLVGEIELPVPPEGNAWIQFEFEKPRRIQAVTAVIGRARNGVAPWEIRDPAWLEVSDDGSRFRRTVSLPVSGAPQQTVSFAPVMGRVFRIVFETYNESSLAIGADKEKHRVAELILHASPRVNRFEDKAGFSTRAIVSSDDTPPVQSDDAIRLDDVVDLTDKMSSDGTLHWAPPRGHWVIFRFGYSLVGRRNNPASKTGTGLEVDKLNRDHVTAYFHRYLGVYRQSLGARSIGGTGLGGVHMGSFEAGPQNWTEDMLDQFARRRGYDARPWLAVLTGRVLESAQASDRFLWDFRRTIGDLFIDAHYSSAAQLTREYGLKLYVEGHAERRAFIADGMRMKRVADFPMGEMWFDRLPSRTATQEVYDADVRETASVANLYGKSLVAAEAFTSCYLKANPQSVLDKMPYSISPEALKPTADRLFVTGANRLILHTSVHQPLETPGPGLTLGPCGAWFTRKETWADQAGAWIDYLSRTSYLLQQGRSVADIAYLYGEDVNVAALFWLSAPPIPRGYNFDYVNAAALTNDMSARGGLLVAPSGSTYRVLALDPSTSRMSLAVLRKIEELVQAGIIVVGPRPTATPSLADDEAEFQRVANRVWGSRSPGSGHVIADRSLADAAQAQGIEPDFSFKSSHEDADIHFAHRRLQGGDIYFISSRNSFAQALDASFRVTGRAPELWYADSGAMIPVSYRTENGRTLIPLDLAANDAIFVVFRRSTAATSVRIALPRPEWLADIDGPWELTFPPNLGAPASVRFDALESWTENQNPGVRYFSGVATYTKSLQIRPEWLEGGGRLQLDLGSVKHVATVILNGRTVGIAWKAPFQLDITDAVAAGTNRLEIKVSNLWTNRLIGDKQPGARTIAYATYDPFEADTPTEPSGLMGPVTLSRSIPAGDRNYVSSESPK